MDRESGAPRRVVLVGGVGGPDGDLVEAFEVEGFDVAAVDTAEGCFDRLAGGVDAIASVQDLPERTGLDLLRSVRSSYPWLPFVLVAADGSERLAGEALAAGADGYVPDREDAETVVDRVLDCLEEGGGAGGAGREGERRYRHLVETSPAPINLFDAEGTCVWGNDAVLDLLGLPDRSELVGRSIFEFIHPEDHGTARQELRAVVEEKRSTGPTAMTLVRDDGERRQIRVATAPGRFGGRDVGQAVVVDVTELLDVQRELEAERRFVDDALDALQDVFFVLDGSGELERWNDRAQEVTGYTEAELRELEFADLVADADVERALASVATTVTEGQDVVEVDVELADGRTVPYEFRCRRLDHPDGGVAGVVGIGRDVSERRERERQLLVFEQLLRHNVRNELNVVLGVAEELEAGRVEDVQASARLLRERAGRLFDQADKVNQLVGMPTRPGDPETVDLAAVVEEVATAARERHPTATVEATAPGTARVRALPRIGDAVAELVDNAIRHDDEGTAGVAIEVSRSGDAVAVSVADEGPGIPASEREILTADREITQLQHGSGVGLWFVYWTTRLSGGRVTFDENDPRGSVVTLELETAGDDRGQSADDGAG